MCFFRCGAEHMDLGGGDNKVRISGNCVRVVQFLCFHTLRAEEEILHNERNVQETLIYYRWMFSVASDCWDKPGAVWGSIYYIHLPYWWGPELIGLRILVIILWISKRQDIPLWFQRIKWMGVMLMVKWAGRSGYRKKIIDKDQILFFFLSHSSH